MELKSLAPYGKPSIEGSEHMNTSELSPAQESITGSWDNSCLWSFSLCIWTLPMFCLFAFHSHFLLFIKIAIKLFVLMLQHNCQLHCQHTSSWYQWDTVRCFHLFNFFFFFNDHQYLKLSKWNSCQVAKKSSGTLFVCLNYLLTCLKIQEDNVPYSYIYYFFELKIFLYKKNYIKCKVWRATAILLCNPSIIFQESEWQEISTPFSNPYDLSHKWQVDSYYRSLFVSLSRYIGISEYNIFV